MAYLAYLTDKDIDNRIEQRWHGEYKRIGEYKAINQKIKVLHTMCGNTFESYIDHLVNHQSVPCLYCNPKSIKNTDIFKYQLHQKFGDEYELIGEYNGAQKELNIIHNLCGTVFTPYASAMLSFREKCPYCFPNSKRMNTEIMSRKISEMHDGDYKLITPYKGSKQDVTIEHDCGYSYNVKPLAFLAGSKQCPICNECVQLDTKSYSQLIKEKYNNRFSLIGEYKDSATKVLIKCNDCKKEFLVNSNNFLRRIGQCPNCDKGISYPSKICRYLLEKNNIKYIPEYNKTNADWCQNYRYDFYLVDYDVIIEVNGGQHYSNNHWGYSLVSVQENDIRKYELAKNHVSQYIVVDAKESDPNYLKETFSNSELKQFIDFSKVDWLEAHNFGLTSFNSKIIKLYNDGIDKKEIAKQLNLSLVTIDRYVRQYKKLISEGAA